jgi:uncharacterized ion transporter superfamily protein YfcC
MTTHHRMPHALVMMLIVIAAAVALTYVIPSGTYDRTPDGLVIPGSFRTVPKDITGGLRHVGKSTAKMAYPAHPIAIVTSIPAGLARTAPLVFMILFVGAMFGVLQQSGALEAGVERLLTLTRGNVYIVAPTVMILLAAGGTFLGLISEYLVLIPIAVLLAERMGFDALFGTAMVTIAAKIGYLTSVTNPLALAVAQPLVGVPVFSGALFRALTFVIFLPLGIWYLLRSVPQRRTGTAVEVEQSAPLGGRHVAVLMVLLLAVAAMIVGVRSFAWGNPELSAMYILVALLIAVVGRIPSRDAAQAFLRGMQGMLLAGVLVGLAAAVEVVLREAMVLDSIVAFLSNAIAGRSPAIVAIAMMGVQMIIDVFIPSTSGKAAITMPILGPIAHIAGVSGQVTVLAFLFGNGLMNTLTPTSGMLLAYLAAGKVSYGSWIKFVFPLASVLIALCGVALLIAVATGL